MKNSKNKIKKHVKDQKQTEKWSFFYLSRPFQRAMKEEAKRNHDSDHSCNSPSGGLSQGSSFPWFFLHFWLKLTNPEKLTVDPVVSVFDVEFSYRPLIVTVGLLGFA